MNEHIIGFIDDGVLVVIVITFLIIIRAARKQSENFGNDNGSGDRNGLAGQFKSGGFLNIYKQYVKINGFNFILITHIVCVTLHIVYLLQIYI